MNIWIVIPAYNEENTIFVIIEKIRHYSENIIVVNDFSTDKTAKILKKLKVITLNNSRNLGYVKSLERGMRHAFNKGADYCITFDADGQHDPADINNIVRILEKDKPDLVIGRRRRKSRFMEEVIGIYAKLRYGISDPLCGFKAFNRSFFKKYDYLENTYTIGTEIIFKGLKKGASFREIVIKTNERMGGARFGNVMKGNYLEVIAFFNILRV